MPKLFIQAIWRRVKQTPAAARLRNQQADRRTVRRSRAVQRGILLSPALPFGGGRPDRGAVGREDRTAPPPLLQGARAL